MQNIKIGKDGVHIGSKFYIGEASEVDISDIGRTLYDCKIYRYPGNKYQVCKCSKKIFRIPVSGIKEFKRYPFIPLDLEERAQRSSREDNILRTKKRIEQIVLSNKWQYFLTITFNDEQLDASDQIKVLDKMQRWLKNQTQRRNLSYLLVAEYHKKDNRIHAHALISGGLDLVESGTYKVEGFKKPVKMDTIKRYHAEERIMFPVYNCKNWKYGFSTAIPVYGTPGRLANYVLKYITKQNDRIFGKSYWCSKNLKLYPDVELKTLPPGDFYHDMSREYWTRAMGASFKYINRLGDEIRDMADDELEKREVLNL